MKYQFYVTDWAPNGTNDLIVRSCGKQVDVLTEALFGVDVNKLATPGKYFERDMDTPVFRIPVDKLKRHVCSGPFGMGFEDNCRRLAKYLRGGK